jgi:hypothetical protein
MHKHETPHGSVPQSARDIRILIAQHWNGPLYVLAARARIHPVTLSGLLSGKRPLRPAFVHRILHVLSCAENSEGSHAQ